MWDQEIKEESTYDFFPYFEDEKEYIIAPIQDTTPPHSPTTPPHSPASSIHEEGSSGGAQKMRSLYDIYDETEEITNNDVNNLFCLFVDSEPLNFEEAMRDKRWRQAMEKEIKAIEKNNTWELSTLPMGHKAVGDKWVYKKKKKKIFKLRGNAED